MGFLWELDKPSPKSLATTMALIKSLWLRNERLEYKLQTMADAPPISTTFIETYDPNAGPHGAKGLAEAPNVPTAAAIANGIAKVIGDRVRLLPMTAERVWETQR